MTKETHPLAHARINTLIGATYASVASLPVHLITLQGDLPKILKIFVPEILNVAIIVPAPYLLIGIIWFLSQVMLLLLRVGTQPLAHANIKTLIGATYAGVASVPVWPFPDPKLTNLYCESCMSI